MTCIVGIRDSGRIWIGGDNIGCTDQLIMVRDDSKVFKCGEMLFGCTSSFRFIQIIKYEFKPPFHEPDISNHEYLVRKCVPILRDLLKTHGFTRVVNNEEFSGECLIGYRGHLFLMCSDFQIGIASGDYLACGCGQQYALGALAAHKIATFNDPEDRINPSDLIKTAIHIAAHFSPFVGQCHEVLSV